MEITDERGSFRRFFSEAWPWLILAIFGFAAVWHFVHFPDDLDVEFPRVDRPTFSHRPPPAYRLAEPGDTIDRVAIYVSSLAIVMGGIGFASLRTRRRRWFTAFLLAITGFWTSSNPSPTFDGWHGLGFPALVHPNSPMLLRFLLGASLIVLIGKSLWSFGVNRTNWREFVRIAKEKKLIALSFVAIMGLVSRFANFPDLEPYGYWPRWAFTCALVAFSCILLKLLMENLHVGRRVAFRYVFFGSLAWLGFVTVGIGLSWYHRPLDRFREIVPGKIFISAMPTKRGLDVAHGRHGFKTIINLFPEEALGRSPKLPQELAFAKQHGIRYVGSPPDVKSSNAFLDETLRLAQDPNAWPILVHCHACMDRTPAWVGIYRFVVEGRPLDEVLRFIEVHRGYRPKASVTLLYNRVLPRLAPERVRIDPTARILREAARGTIDPYEETLRTERERANSRESGGVRPQVQEAASGSRPSLTPRR